MRRKLLAFAALAMVVLTTGCASTPLKSRDRIGDFVSDIAMAPAATDAHRS